MRTWSPCAPLDASCDTAALARAYVAALEGFDPTLLDRSDRERYNMHRLSGLLLPSMPTNLHQAQQRIMLVGAETKTWEVLQQGEAMDSLSSYVDRAMAKHERVFKRCLAQRKQDRGRSFMNFLRDVARQCGADGLIYTNLLCCAWKKGSPLKSPHYKTIQEYSARLLKAQVEFFAPSIIIFANGLASAGARRAVFPIEGPDKVCSKGMDYVASHQIPNSQLWEFELNDSIRCYRIQHPSSREDRAADARRFLLALLPHL
jgi:hypothetical protein